jgi:hypothetical protein
MLTHLLICCEYMAGMGTAKANKGRDRGRRHRQQRGASVCAGDHCGRCSPSQFRLTSLDWREESLKAEKHSYKAKEEGIAIFL